MTLDMSVSYDRIVPEMTSMMVGNFIHQQQQNLLRVSPYQPPQSNPTVSSSTPSTTSSSSSSTSSRRSVSPLSMENENTQPLDYSNKLIKVEKEIDVVHNDDEEEEEDVIRKKSRPSLLLSGTPFLAAAAALASNAAAAAVASGDSNASSPPISPLMDPTLIQHYLHNKSIRLNAEASVTNHQDSNELTRVNRESMNQYSNFRENMLRQFAYSKLRRKRHHPTSLANHNKAGAETSQPRPNFDFNTSSPPTATTNSSSANSSPEFHIEAMMGPNKKLKISGKDDSYWERRRKNNEAAKRSRDSRRAKEDEIAIRAAFLEQENIQLKWDVARYKSETDKLRRLLMNEPSSVLPAHVSSTENNQIKLNAL